MSSGILVINAGSSSLKFSLFSVEAASPTLKINGQIEGIGAQPHFIATAADTVLAEQYWSAEVMDREALLEHLLGWIRDYLGESPLRAVGHRVVFGGERHRAPVRVNAEVMTRLTELIPLMPLHLPVNLAPIEAISRVHPDAPGGLLRYRLSSHDSPTCAALCPAPCPYRRGTARLWLPRPILRIYRQ